MDQREPLLVPQADKDLENRFNQHAPNHLGIANKHTDYRAACLTMGRIIKELVPNGREQALALTNLEQVMFWGNAGIARNQED